MQKRQYFCLRTSLTIRHIFDAMFSGNVHKSAVISMTPTLHNSLRIQLKVHLHWTKANAKYCRPHGKVMFTEASVCSQEGGVLGRPFSRQTPSSRWHPLRPGRLPWYWHLATVTAVVGTHPTGMYFCFLWPLSLFNVNVRLVSLWTLLQTMSLWD